MSTLGLLAGIFAAPAVLLWLGNGYRDLDPRMRRVFWGGVTGWILGVVALTTAGLLPPVPWAEGGLRALVVHWGAVAGALGGAVGGAGLAAVTRPGQRPQGHAPTP